MRCHNGIPIVSLVRLTNLTYLRDVSAGTYMRLTSLIHSDVLAGTLSRLNYLRCWRNVLSSTQKKLTHYSEQIKRPWPCWDIIATSHLVREWDGPIWDVFATPNWYVNKADQFEMSQRCTNCYLSETDQFNTLQRLSTCT